MQACRRVEKRVRDCLSVFGILERMRRCKRAGMLRRGCATARACLTVRGWGGIHDWWDALVGLRT
eukprot:366208-Chlamydomonas_euryale.AAC.1